jgi:hypothetical protein
MARKCHIEGSMITAVWTHLRMFLNSKFYCFTFKCWILLKLVLGGVDGNLQFYHRPWTGSIKPSLHHFQFCRIGLSLGILYLSIFWSIFHSFIAVGTCHRRRRFNEKCNFLCLIVANKEKIDFPECNEWPLGVAIRIIFARAKSIQ